MGTVAAAAAIAEQSGPVFPSGREKIFCEGKKTKTSEFVFHHICPSAGQRVASFLKKAPAPTMGKQT